MKSLEKLYLPPVESNSGYGPVTAILNMSIKNGHVTDDWRKADVAPIFKKGGKYDPSNYMPVSLTRISCKGLEHILVNNIMNHRWSTEK